MPIVVFYCRTLNLKFKCTNIPSWASILDNTDEYASYNLLPMIGYNHGIVAYADKVYLDDGVQTNSLEGFWSQVKNGIRGFYVVCSLIIVIFLSVFLFSFILFFPNQPCVLLY